MQDFVAAPEGSDDELLGLEDALAVLPEQQRRAILLREWHGLSYREVAVELGLTQSAVEALIFRARRSLARALETVAPRPRLVHAFHPAALLGSLKSALSGSLATGVAVAASATVIAAGPIVADSAPKVFAEPEPAAVDRMADVPRLVVGLSAAGAESGRGHARAGKGEERNGPPPWAHGGSEAKPEKASPPSWGKGGSPAASASKGKKG